MLSRIQQIGFIKGNYVIGIQVSFRSANQNSIYHLVGVKKTRGKVSLVKQLVDITSVEELQKHIPKNTPVVICIDGKNLIHKYVQDDVGEKAIDYVLPNANKDDFYVQTAKVNDGFFISVIRKSIVDEITNKFLSIKVIPALIYLGPFITSYTNFIYSDGLKYKTEFWSIFGNESNVEYTSSNSSDSLFIFLKGESIRDFCIPVYCLSLSYLIDIDYSEISVSKKLKEDFRFKRATWLGGWFLLSLVFIILLVNFIFFSNYNDKYQSINNLIQQNQSLLSKNDELKEKYTQKRRFIERSGLLESSKYSFYSDRIARIVPDSVQLTSIQISPVNDKIRSDKPIVYNQNIIIVSGKCFNNLYFNLWKDQLKQEDWLRTITINQFGQEEPDKPLVFEIQLEIK